MTISKNQFWLIQDKLKFQFPYNPENIKIKSSSNNATIEIDELGDITIFKELDLVQFSFNSHFPASYFYGCEYKNLLTPENSKKLIDKMRNNQAPVKFIVTNTFINQLVSIDSFDTTIEGGDIDSIYFSISLKECRSTEPKKLITKTTSTKTTTTKNSNSKTVKTLQEKPRVDTRVKVKTYTVVSGDSLWKIAQQQLGNGSRYGEIAKLNNIGPKYTIQVGQVLRLP